MKDSELIAMALPGHDAVIHNALCWGNSARDMLLNDMLTSTVLFEAAALAGIPHFLYTSSTAAFGEFKRTMTEDMKSDPINYYCATKSASEQYLLAVSYLHPMRCNIVRPGYTFGNPVIPGARMQGDARIHDIVAKARRNEPITLVDNDGTQFIWAGDLARIYIAALHTPVNHQIYHGLSVPFIAWEAIARKAIELCASRSEIVLTPNLPTREPCLFDLSKIRRDFALEFDGWPHMVRHLEYLVAQPLPTK
jgi:UDP-glucose 4-epimerase